MTQRQPRLLDPGYLDWLRKQPCACGCRRPPPCDAAHLKAASLKYNKPFSGSMRPDDCWALPLKREHHMAQHKSGDELGWWSAHGIADPFALAIKHYSRYGGVGGTARSARKIKPRKPRYLRAKLRSRNTLRKATR